MRLDHLLSKEHVHPRPCLQDAVVVPSQFRDTLFLLALMGGTLTLMRIGMIRYEYAFSFGGRKESTGPAWFACCTLLGPEGPEPPGEPGWDCTSGPSPVRQTPVGGRQGGYRPYFENYTVDASILDLNI